MQFLTGEFECKLDSKGRLTLPSRLKGNMPDSASNELVIRIGLEPCLLLYPSIEYKKVFSRIAGLNEFNEEYRRLQRNFFRGTANVELDNAGRILIPKSMVGHASLEKDCVLVGMGNRIEIWDASKYEDYLINDPQELSELAQKYLDEE